MTDDVPTCRTCRFWSRLGGPQGECRRHAPGLPADPAPGYAGRVGAFPLVLYTGWCGEHEGREPRGAADAGRAG